MKEEGNFQIGCPEIQVPVKKWKLKRTRKSANSVSSANFKKIMSSSYPITKSVRWRMKDWVSCFNTCRLPMVDEEKETSMEISPPFPPTTSVHHYSKGGDRRRRQDIIDRQTRIDFTCNEGIKEAGIKVSPMQKGLSKNSSNNSQMSEEEYIVFCFRENGDIRVIEDRKSSVSSDQNKSKFVKRKLMYAENVEPDPIINIQVVSKYKEDKNQETCEDDIRISCEKAYEEGKTNSGTADQWLLDEIKESSLESKQEEGTLLESSAGSNMSSEESTTSFSFPVLLGSRRSWEWMGSPVLVPRKEDVAPRSSNSKDNRSRLHFRSF